MTNTQNLTKEQAKAAARAGAKVKWAGWGPLAWTENPELHPHLDGWSIVTPAPDAVGNTDTGKGDGDLRQAAELAKAIHARHWSGEAEWRPAPTLSEVLLQIDNMTAGLVRAASPTFTTTRKPPPDDVPLFELAYPQEPTTTLAPITRESAIAASRANVFVSFGDSLDTAPATNPHPEGSRKWGPWVPEKSTTQLGTLMAMETGMQIKRTNSGLKIRYRVTTND